MRAVISDIHANLEALTAVLEDIDRVGCTDIYCLGDIVGYGPDPLECIRVVRDRCAVCTMGNHDFSVVKVPFGFNRFARESIEWTKKVLKPGFFGMGKRKIWKWIESLPSMHEEDDVMYLHASPLDPIMDYVKEADVLDMGLGVGEKIREIFSRIKRICFVGHTHKPAVITDDYTYLVPGELEENRLVFEEGRKYLVNVGSVGQPRDEVNTSCYVVFDRERNTVEYRRVRYDFEKTLEKIRAVKEIDDRMGERLRDGK